MPIKTARGRTLDMDALIAKNESVRAVGNMSVNARGDTIDSHGRIVTPVTQKVGEGYQKTVTNKSAQANRVKPATVPTRNTSPNKKVTEQLTPEERELEGSLEEDLEIENLKKQHLAKQHGRKN